MVWRVLTSQRLHVGLRELEKHWSVDDLLDAHVALDLWEDLEEKARAK